MCFVHVTAKTNTFIVDLYLSKGRSPSYCVGPLYPYLFLGGHFTYRPTIMSGYAPLTPDQLAHINDSKVPTINGVDAVLMALVLVAVAARFYARRIRKLALKIDDWLMIPSLVGDFLKVLSITSVDSCSFLYGPFVFVIS